MPPKHSDSNANPSLSPIRIYVLWHPDMDKSEGPALKNRGITLARRIYHWFRIENMEGIPVYFRSAPTSGGNTPLPVVEDPGVRNYLLVLIDANMVASPDWRAYVSKLANLDRPDGVAAQSATGETATPFHMKSHLRPAEYRLLPVAMESLAYNMPANIRDLNFIRHVPRGTEGTDDFELLARITEVLCRDLRQWLSRESSGAATRSRPTANLGVPGKIKIFLSHAKADDTEEAISIKEYIQRETQCEAFFDETDIAAGHDFTKVLENAITEESAGLIVLQGDNYADRPWCRKEIRDFLKPVEDPLAAGSSHKQYAIAPVVVVQTMKGRQIARTIPELGYAPCVRWQKDREDGPRFVVTTLLREICFGLFYRALAHRVALLECRKNDSSIYLNRSPDPVTINRIVAHCGHPRSQRGKAGKLAFAHPGYGLSKLEHDGLTAAFPGYEFRSFLGGSREAPALPLDLRGRIIAVSVGNPGDLLPRGFWEEHIQELLIRLLRPLLQAQTSLLYGGRMPKSFRPECPWDESINFTAVLLQLLIGDRDTGKKHPDPPRLFVPVACHDRSTVTASVVAQWSDVCSFVHVSLEDSGITQEELSATAPVKPDEESRKYMTDAEKRDQDEEFIKEAAAFAASRCALMARATSAMRRRICDSKPLKSALTCELPDRINPDDTSSNRRSIDTFAHILIGGKATGFSGIMPGIFEEALCAFDAKKPVFLIAEYGGAAAILANWLLNPPETRPPELTPEYYAALPSDPEKPTYAQMLAGFEQLSSDTPPYLTPASAFDRLWVHIKSVHGKGRVSSLLNNALNDKENRELLETSSSGEIFRRIWRGIAGLSGQTTQVIESNVNRS